MAASRSEAPSLPSPGSASTTVPAFHRDRLTWVVYVVAAWFAYLQASPGLVLPQLRAELDLSYTTAGLHVAAFAAGATAAGLLSARLDRALGRRTLLWWSAALMAAGLIALTAGRLAVLTVASVLVMGLGGGLLLATMQAVLADHHGERRTVALAEENLAASLGYLTLIGGLALAAALSAGWRIALLISLVVPALAWWSNRQLTITAAPAATASRDVGGRLPTAFWIAAAVLFCTTAAEWCVASWGASFAEDAAGVSAGAAVVLMAGYFGGVLAGRLLGSRLARRHQPTLLLAAALAMAGVGFAVLWPSSTPMQVLVGLALLGVGLGNLYPMAVSVAVALAPGLAAQASGRAVAMSSFAVVLAPITVGALADTTSLQAALLVVPAMLTLAAAGLALVSRRPAGTRPRVP